MVAPPAHGLLGEPMKMGQTGEPARRAREPATVSPAPSPKVSIGLPVFNGMRYLPQSLNSLLAQTEGDIEIVISDNASDDGTEEYCRSVAASDSRVTYRRNDVNIGAAANFWQAFALSRGPFFAWAAHDDVYGPEFVSTCVQALHDRPEAAFCVTAHQRIDEEGNLLSVRREPAGLASSELETRLRAHLWRRGWLTIYGVWRRQHLEQVGPLPAVWGSDVILVWRALLNAPGLTVEQPLTSYRVFEAKTADETLEGITASSSHRRFPHSRMVTDLWADLARGGATPLQQRVARRVLLRWVFSRHYRELVFSDLWIEARRYGRRRAWVRAALMIPPMAVSSPSMSLRGARRAIDNGLLRARSRRAAMPRSQRTSATR